MSSTPSTTVFDRHLDDAADARTDAVAVLAAAKRLLDALRADITRPPTPYRAAGQAAAAGAAMRLVTEGAAILLEQDISLRSARAARVATPRRRSLERRAA